MMLMGEKGREAVVLNIPPSPALTSPCGKFIPDVCHRLEIPVAAPAMARDTSWASAAREGAGDRGTESWRPNTGLCCLVLLHRGPKPQFVCTVLNYQLWEQMTHLSLATLKT